MESWGLNRRLDKTNDQLTDIYKELHKLYIALEEAVKKYDEFMKASKNDSYTHNA